MALTGTTVEIEHRGWESLGAEGKDWRSRNHSLSFGLGPLMTTGSAGVAVGLAATAALLGGAVRIGVR